MPISKDRQVRKIIMYVRFVSPLKSEVKGVDLGIFQCAIECRDNEEFPEYYRESIRSDFEWFKKYLPSPNSRVFDVKSRGVYYAHGICWFRSEASEMIERAFALSALIKECGYYITTIGTRDPGQILYQDDYQIVAKPTKATPTRWG